MEYWGMDRIIRENQRRGKYFFSPDTLRFFSSRIHYPAYNGPGGVYFVTSEKSRHNPRCYTIRKFYPDTGDIVTWPDYEAFQAYKSRNGAHKAAMRAATGG